MYTRQRSSVEEVGKYSRAIARPARCLTTHCNRMDSFVRNEVLCTFSQQAYSGGCVVCLLRGLPLDPCITATVKAHGYLKLDAKWLVNAAVREAGPPSLADLALSSNTASQSTEEATEHSYSIFRTKSVVIPSSYSSASSGVFVQFDLAEEGGTLPSFKGLHGVVSYHLLIHLQHSAHNNDAHIAFPFRVSGRGSATQSYLQSVESDIVVYAEDSLPPDHLFARVDDYSFLDEMKTHNLVYSIRDERHICNIAFTSPIFQEDFVVLVFDFDRCESNFTSLHITLLRFTSLYFYFYSFHIILLYFYSLHFTLHFTSLHFYSHHFTSLRQQVRTAVSPRARQVRHVRGQSQRRSAARTHQHMHFSPLV